MGRSSENGGIFQENGEINLCRAKRAPRTLTVEVLTRHSPFMGLKLYSRVYFYRDVFRYLIGFYPPQGRVVT